MQWETKKLVTHYIVMFYFSGLELNPAMRYACNIKTLRRLLAIPQNTDKLCKHFLHWFTNLNVVLEQQLEAQVPMVWKLRSGSYLALSSYVISDKLPLDNFIWRDLYRSFIHAWNSQTPVDPLRGEAGPEFSLDSHR